MIDVRLLHHLQELARICRQGLDVAPLAFGINSVEGERRLAGPRQAGDDNELVARQVDVNVLEIVLARAFDGNQLLHVTRWISLSQGNRLRPFSPPAISR